MIEELHIASGLLHTALERYTNACSALHNEIPFKNTINGVPELLSVMNNELQLVESYKGELTRAQVAVKKTRNSLANAPINTLPAEVLMYIFRLILSQRPCPLRVINHWNPRSPARFPKYPDILSHVCSRWRQIALASHELWSHIDIALSCSLSKRFHKRAITYVARAYPMPLDIHFIDPGCVQQAYNDGSEPYDSDEEISEWVDLVYDYNPGEFTFLDFSPEPRIKSIGLLAQYRYHPIHNRALEYCLANCLPGSLSELVIDAACETLLPNRALPDSGFFETNPDLHNQEHVSAAHLFLSEQQLELAWHSTTSLVLKGRYPRWTSAAYHGLTELRLYGEISISSSDLAGVLKSSPGLLIFHCGVSISDRSLSAMPVTLQSLEILDLRDMFRGDAVHLLQLVNPGPGPLRLLIWDDPTSSILKDFLIGSNVQELYVRAGLGSMGHLESNSDTPYLTSRLRTLAMVNYNWAYSTNMGWETLASPRLYDESPSHTKLDTLYILTCHYENLQHFRAVVAKYSPRRLVLWNCRIFDHIDRTECQINLPLLESAFGDGLSQFCPSIECLASCDPNPLRDWD